MTNVSIIKLISGVDLVGIITEELDSSINISEPYQIAYNIDTDSISFIPFSFWSYDTVFNISRNHILYISSSMELLAKRYSEVVNKTNKEIKSEDELDELLFDDTYEYDEFEVNNNKESNITLH